MNKLLLFTKYILLLFCVSSCSMFNTNSITSTKIIYLSNYWNLLSQGNKIYILSFPIESNTNTQHRNLHYFMLVYNTNEKTYTISIVGGKNYEILSEVIIKVNYNEYYLPVANDRAWLTNQQKVNSFIEDMKISNELIIINNFADKTNAIDIYLLKGFNEAIKSLDKIIKPHQLQ